MPPVAIPATASCRKSARTASSAWLLAELGQDLDHLLLAVHDLDQEADAVDVAPGVPGGLHQDARLLRWRDGHAMQALRQRLAIELAQLLGGVLHRVYRRVALDAVVVGQVLEALLELVAEFLQRLDRRVGGEANVALHAVGSFTCELDHFLADDVGLADDWLLDALLARLAQHARAFFLVGIDEDGI